MRRNIYQQLTSTVLARPASKQAGVAVRLPLSVRGVAEWIVRRELLWLALLSPLFLFPSKGWALVVGVLPVLWIARYIARGRYLPRTPLDWPIALLAAMVPVSLFATFSIEYSLGKVLGLLFGIALYYALIEVGSAEWGVRSGESSIVHPSQAQDPSSIVQPALLWVIASF